MNQLSFDTQPQTLLLINELVERLATYESHLTEIRRSLHEMNCKVDSLLAQSNGNHAPPFNSTFGAGNIATLDVPGPSFVPTPHMLPPNANQNLTDVWGLDGEFGRPGTYTVVV